MPGGAELAADVASRGQYRFTVEEFRRMPELGVIDDNARVELIEGVVVPMSPVRPAHYSVIYLLEERLRAAIEPRFRVRVQSEIQLGTHSQAQPDISVITPRRDGYRQRLPDAADCLLLVEVADSNLSRVRRDKVPLYALHGIREFWLINVAECSAVIFRDPADGVFCSARDIGPDEALSPLIDPGVQIALSSLFAAGRDA